MEPRIDSSLDEDLESVINARKTPLWRRLAGIVMLAAVGVAAYAYWGDLMAWISRKPASASADSSVANGTKGGERGGRNRGGGRGGNTTSVAVMAAKTADLPVYLRGLGSVTPYASVAVRSRVDGQLISTSFQEGQLVHAGDVLAQVDKRPFEVQLLQAQGQLSQAKGNLARDTALLQSAKFEQERNQALLDKGLIPRQQFDLQVATIGQYQGSIEADQASMEVANAAIANANLQISYSQITAPITGRIGLRLVDSGNIIRAADPNGLAVIAQIQPIAVLFNIPEDDLGPVLKKLQAGANLRVDLYDRDDQTKLSTGRLATVDNQIDQSTGTSRLKAVFENTDNALFPNQFVNVHLLLDVLHGATVISAAAVQRGPQGTYVYVVDSDRKAHVRPVTIKETEGNDVALSAGLQPGELVVVEGTDKVQDNATVDAQIAGKESSVPPSQDDARGKNGDNPEGGEQRQGRQGRGRRS
jgi:multidrug efflux system membrane fusion protein